MKESKMSELLEILHNGNITPFKQWLKRASKLEMLELIKYNELYGYCDNGLFTDNLTKYLRDMKKCT